MRTVTLRDVAQAVGVTPAAVSLALSGSPRISERTKDAVVKAAAELGYVPSSAGRALRSQRSGTVALIVPNTSQHVFGHMYFMHVLTGVSEAANEHDAQVLVSTNAEEVNGVTAYQRVMRSRSADGAIVTSAAIDDGNIATLVSSGLPVVLIGNFPYLRDVVSVGIDDVAATRQITDHLVAVHRRSHILHVTGTLDHQTGVDRREGFYAAIAEARLPKPTVIEGDLSEASGAAAIERALDGAPEDGPPFDGIVFANDDMALGGMRVLQRHGIRVPEDVSVVGFDDFGLARVVTPGLTTVAVPAEEMARRATERLFQIIDGDRSGAPHQELPVQIVVRRSCGCGEQSTPASP